MTLSFRLTCSVALWGGRMLQTNNTGTLVCACSASATLGLPPLTVHTAQALGCSTGNTPKLALGCMHLPRLSRSGSGTRVVFKRCRLGWACVLCPSQVQAAQLMRCLVSMVTATYRLPCPCRSVFWVYNRRTFSGKC